MRGKSGCRTRNIVLFVLISLLLNGCLEYDEQIILKPDGSGELFIHYAAERDMRFQNLYFPTDIYEVEQNIQENYLVSGVELLSREIRQKGDETHVYMRFRFDNLEDLNRAPRFEREEFRLIHGGNGQWTVKRFLYLEEKDLGQAKLLAKSGFRGIFDQEVLNEIKFRFQMILPGKIESTNADVILAGDHVLWETTLSDILKENTVEFVVRYTIL